MTKPLSFMDRYGQRWVSVSDLIGFLDAQAAELMTDKDDEQMAVLCIWLARSFAQFATTEPNSTVVVDAGLHTEAEMRADLKEIMDDLRER